MPAERKTSTKKKIKLPGRASGKRRSGPLLWTRAGLAAGIKCGWPAMLVAEGAGVCGAMWVRKAQAVGLAIVIRMAQLSAKRRKMGPYHTARALYSKTN